MNLDEGVDFVRCACSASARLVSGTEVYPHRSDLHNKWFWKCNLCRDSFVGCHPGTKKPLGIPADAETRKARQLVHYYFDPIWKGGDVKRIDAYSWLRIELQGRMPH